MKKCQLVNCLYVWQEFNVLVKIAFAIDLYIWQVISVVVKKLPLEMKYTSVKIVLLQDFFR